ncbi:MAG: arginine repressor [Eubacterium sp.]|nr:arginine repressor [Eubacterium sp.]
MKKRRQAKILEIIRNLDVETQEDLQALLLENGFEVTQATISRDIKELRLVKELSDSGRYVYSTGKKNSSDSVSARASGIFIDSVIRVENAMNMVCIKCFAGMAGAACAAIDSMQWNEVVGTIAGDDTIFVLCKTEHAATVFTANLEKLLNVKNA